MKLSLDKVIVIPSLVLPPVFLVASVYGVYSFVSVCTADKFESLPAEGKQLGIVMFAVSTLTTGLSAFSLYLSFCRKAFRPSFLLISIVLLIFSLYLLYYDLCPWSAIQ